ncbi:MAG: isoprenyl transferase [bacterium]
MNKTKTKKVPTHIAIIMDGNGRWAKKKLLPKKLGHKAGAEALNKLLDDLENTQVKHVTVYAFSTENWKRSQEEIQDLMHLLKEYIDGYIRKNKTTNIKINTIGNLDAFDDELREKLKYLEEISKDKTGVNLHIALNYGGRDDITRAMQKIALDIKDNKIGTMDINEDLINSYLDTKDIGDPELIIRTSGEYRISNFLLWQCAYSEFYFTDKYWPDFNIKDLEEAIDTYLNRERRFGGRI